MTTIDTNNHSDQNNKNNTTPDFNLYFINTNSYLDKIIIPNVEIPKELLKSNSHYTPFHNTHSELEKLFSNLNFQDKKIQITAKKDVENPGNGKNGFIIRNYEQIITDEMSKM